MSLKNIAITCICVFSHFLPCAAQSNCDEQLLRYEDWKETAATKWNLSISSGNGGQLNYFGARHTDQPNDTQFLLLKKYWEAARPTIAFYEGPNRGIAGSDTATIRRYGESGYVRFLAEQAGIKAVSLEPPPAALYQYLVSKQPQQRVDLYFLLNESMRLRTRKGYSKDQIIKELDGMLKKMPSMLGLTSAIQSIGELENAYKQFWGNKSEWWQAPQEWFDPNKKSANTGGIFTNEINTLSSSFRNVYMYKLLAEHVNNGERVIAVIGRNHVPVQEPALRCAIH